MKKRNSSEGWLVVFAGFLTLTVGAGIGWYVLPVYLGAIHEDTGWSITALTFAITVWALAGAVFSPPVGLCIQKYGPKKVMLVGTVCQIVITFLLSRMTEQWHMYVLFVGAAFANAANTYIPISTAISQWFDEKRGMAMGMALVGMGVGGLIVPPLAKYFLINYGWRRGYFLFSFFLVALLVPISLWIQKGPEADSEGDDDEGRSENAPPAESTPARATQDTGGLMAAESMRTRSFWGLGLGDLLIGVLFTTVIVNMPFFTVQSGVSEWGSTMAYSTFLAIQAIGIFVFGAASDKFKIRGLMIFCYGVPALAMLCLLKLPDTFFLYTFAVVFGLTGGGRSALWPLALTKTFGVKDIGTIFGWLNIPFMLGNAMGPLLGGYIYDTTGSFDTLFVLSAAGSAISIFFVALMRKEYGRRSSA